MHRDKRNAHCLYLYALSARSAPAPYYTSVGYCLFVHRSFHNLLSDKRTTPHFLFYIPRHAGAEWQIILKCDEKIFIFMLGIYDDGSVHR